jgi:DNA mismatch repair protein MutL
MSGLTLPKNPGGLYTLDDASRRIVDSGDEFAIREAVENLFGDAGIFDTDQAQGDALLRVEKQGFYVYYHGYASAPEVTMDTDAFQYFYVNGRFVREKTLQDSVRAAYRKLAAPGQYPLCCLFLTIKPYRLDEIELAGENVVRFYDPYNVGGFCRDAVIEALRRRGYK